MSSFDLSTLSTLARQDLLQHVIAPRPICFASTISKDGEVNLSPFSYFNIFSAHPPIVVFSPARRVRDNTTKHTLENVYEVPEVVINIADASMVQQVSLASHEYPRGTNEFIKAGLEMAPSEKVRPPRVKQCKASMECRVQEIKPLGKQAGAGNLVICEVLVLHVDDRVLDSNGKIDPFQLNYIARMGGDWYCRVGEENMFIVPKPGRETGIGIDQLPNHIRTSPYLTPNDLALLATVSSIPTKTTEIEKNNDIANKHEYAHQLLQKGEVLQAWAALLDL
jgi:flavin reductase (DIM6/NTAB) family NADH-FMN oxidoreductase RutF